VGIDGFDEIMNMISIAKMLNDMGRYHLVTDSFVDDIDYDNYYEGMYVLIGNIFDYSSCNYYEHRNFELHVLSDAVIVNFYLLAGEYGKLHKIPNGNNPYIESALKEVRNQLNISHCMDWHLAGHTEPKRPFHSRLGIVISHDCGCCDIGVIAYRLLQLLDWFENECCELKAHVAAFKSQTQIRSEDQ